jgi:D-alanine--poly(phosphoribitol) ligase subunit 1
VIAGRLENSLTNYSAQIAVEDCSGEWGLSYSQLGKKSVVFNKAFGSFDGVLILYMEKSPSYYIAAFSCFRYSLNFCPIDVINPSHRLKSIASQFQDVIILTDTEERLEVVKKAKLRTVLYSFNDCTVVQKSNKHLKRDNPLYYIATSGSTGQPKIVEVNHNQTHEFVNWSVDFYRIDNDTRWAQFSSIGFDLSIVDLLTVLSGGGTLISISKKLDHIRPAKAIKKANITHWHSVPSVISYILSEENFSNAIQLFTFCGEPLATVDVEKLQARFPDSRIINTYGPTEGTLFCSYYEIIRGNKITTPTLPIGQPIPGWNFVLLQENQELLLIIVSNHIANGYLGIESDSFSSSSFYGSNVRTFNTSDYFRYDHGQLIFHRRHDSMVKVSGNRIDLGDVEAAGRSIGLQNPVVLFQSGTLILFCEGGDSLNQSEIREQLGKLLPAYEVPRSIRVTSLHPRNSNGKINRAELIRLHIKESY